MLELRGEGGDGGLVRKPAADRASSPRMPDPPILSYLSDTDVFATLVGGLTSRQLRVLTLLADGRCNKEIARACGVSSATAKAHVAVLLKRLNLKSRTQAAVRYAVLADRMTRDVATMVQA